MDKKLQIFISSTYEDLKKERQELAKAILEMGHIPAGMEYFVSDDISQFDMIKRWIDESDAYILLVGGRYGSSPKDNDKSYTILEYEYAKSKNKPIKIIMLTEKYLAKKLTKGDYTEAEIEDARQKKFRNELNTANLVGSLSGINGACKTLINSFTKELNSKKVGWVSYGTVKSLVDVHRGYNLDIKNRLHKEYHIYYYAVSHERPVYSTLNINLADKTAIFKNDINKRAKYIYKGVAYVNAKTLYIEALNENSDEIIFMSVQLPPRKLDFSIGIILGQSTMGLPVSGTFVISNKKIDSVAASNSLRKIQKISIDETEKLLVDENIIGQVKQSLRNS